MASINMAYGEAFLEEVVVTATRRAQSTQDIPYNISAMTSDMLERQGIVDFSKLARNVAGLTYVDAGPREAGVNNGLIIRGLSSGSDPCNDTQSLAAPTVSTYVGETPLFVNLHLKDIERVEVLRGPQGTLYGSGSLGGTIRYIPYKPNTEEFSLELGVEGSTTEQAGGLNSDIYAVINAPLGNSVALRVVAGRVENQGYIDANAIQVFDDNGQPVLEEGADFFNPDAQPVTRRKDGTNGNEIEHIRASLLWNISDNASVILTHQRQNDTADGRGVSGGEDFGGNEYAHANRFLDPLERDIELTALDLEWDLGFATLSSSTSTYENEADLISDQSGLYLNSNFWNPDSPEAVYGYMIGPRDAIFGNYTQDTEAFAQEIRLASNGDGPLSWVVGAFYQDQEQENAVNDIAPGWWAFMGFPEAYTPGYFGTREELAGAGIMDDSIYRQVQETDFTDRAIFGEVSYHFTDKFQATVGFRAFDQTYESTSTIYLPQCGVFCSNDGVDPTGKTGGSVEEDFTDQIFKFNLSYDVSDSMMAYFTWAEGFRHGGTNGIPTTDVAPNAPFAEDPALANYDSDLATNWEVGLKGTLLGGNLRFSTALFLIEWDDVQIDASSPVGVFPILVNGESAESTGLELEATWAASENLTFSAGYAYTKAELTEDFDIGEVVGFDGDRLPEVPEHSGSVRVNYYQVLSDNMGLNYNLSGSYISSTEAALNELDPGYSKTKAYDLWDASMVLEAEDWSVTLFVDNIGDEYVYSYGRGDTYNNVEFNPMAGRDVYGFINVPRTFGLGLKYQF